MTVEPWLRSPSPALYKEVSEMRKLMESLRSLLVTIRNLIIGGR